MDQSEKCNTYLGSIKCQEIANIYIIENTTYLTKKEVKKFSERAKKLKDK